MPNHRSKAADIFRALHAEPGGFIMPNAWDAGSAAVLQSVGFPAVATTSAGIAFSLGRQDFFVASADGAVTRDEMFERMRMIAAAVEVPVNGDLEAGFGDSPEDVANTVEDAIAAGLAGGNIEDKRPLADELYDETLAVERIIAARERISKLKSGFVLTARTDAFTVKGKAAVSDVVRRSNRYFEAGADCAFAPGQPDPDVQADLCKQLAGPLNVVLGFGSTEGNAHRLIEAGVKRISVGGTLARTVLGHLRQCSIDLRDRGTIEFANQAISHGDLNALFGSKGK